jgi:putative acetyltransferase
MIAEVPSVRAASRQLVRELGFLNEAFPELECTAAQCHALLELELHGVLTAGELAEILLVDKSSATRVVSQLLERGLCDAVEDAHDRRRRRLVLTAQGRARLERVHAAANRQVDGALALLTPPERGRVLEGIGLYAKALRRARLQAGYELRLIRAEDDPDVARIIRSVLGEHGICGGAGTALGDAEVSAMSAGYRPPRAQYFVVVDRGRVVGGGGFAPLAGGDRRTCELRKMYFLPDTRGLGLGARLLSTCLEAARSAGYARCYLETMQSMERARRLYEAFGFRPLTAPEGATGHTVCNAWYALELGGREQSRGRGRRGRNEALPASPRH